MKSSGPVHAAREAWHGRGCGADLGRPTSEPAHQLRARETATRRPHKPKNRVQFTSPQRKGHMKLRRALHVLGILATVASGAFVQFASSGGAPRWALNAAAWAGLIAALVTNLGRAIATAAVDDVMVAQTTTTVVSLPLTTTGDLTPVDNPSRQAP